MEGAGLRLDEALHHGKLATVYRGVRLADGLGVIVKRLERPRPGAPDALQFEREIAIARRLRGPGVVRVLERLETAGGPALVMADDGAESLALSVTRGGRLAIGEALRLAEGVAAALERVHAAGVVHKDVNPSNIIWNRDRGLIELIDFGISAELAREASLAEDVHAVEGTLAYLAPEQTGRMNRSLDWRADLYSLGATLYELLTGRPPFVADDALGLIHAHIARAPRPPEELAPEIAPAVSAIVLKLLAKDPEERYQSAAGVRRDLRICLDALATTGVIGALVPGAGDRRERFHLPERLYGREDAIQRLLDAYQRVIDGPAELFLLSGPAGIGKSALVGEVRRPMSERRGRFVEGKFERLKRNIPYSALTMAFGQLARQLLAEPESELAGHRHALATALGINAGLVIDLIPDFALVLGPQADTATLAPIEASWRFQNTFKSLVGALATADTPLVIFLDDLQWADRPSLGLLAALLANPTPRHLLIVGAHRDGEVTLGHPLYRVVETVKAGGVRVETLPVGPLDDRAVQRLLADTIDREDQETAALARLCLERTGGNPFFLGQFLRMLAEDGLLAFDHAAGLWRWERARVAERADTDNVVTLMVDKLRRLDPEVQKALALAATIGGRFDLGTLAMVAERPAAELGAILWPALGEGVLLPTSANYRYAAGLDAGVVGYRFAHDRVREAAQALISEDMRLATHSRVGALLLEGLSEEERGERLFEVVDHLNLGRGASAPDAPLPDPFPAPLHPAPPHPAPVTPGPLNPGPLNPGPLNLARLNQEAARRAAAAAAHGSALAYAEAGLDLLGSTGWRDAYALTLALHETLAEAASMTNDTQRLESVAAVVMANARAPHDTLRLQYLRIVRHIAGGAPEEAIGIVLSALRSIGLEVPERPSRLRLLLDLARGHWLVWRHGEHPRAKPVDVDDRRIAALCDLLAATGAATFAARKDLIVPLAVRSLEAALLRGYHAFLPGAFAYWATVCSVIGATARAASTAQRAIAHSAGAGPAGYPHRSIFVALSLGRIWAESPTAIRAQLISCFHMSVDAGDQEYAGHCLMVWLRTGWQTGVELSRLAIEAEDTRQTLSRGANDFHGPLAAAIATAIATLRDGRGGRAGDSPLDTRDSERADMVAGLRDRRMISTLANLVVVELQLAVLFGDGDRASALGREADGLAQGLLGSPSLLVLRFYRALSEVPMPGAGPRPSWGRRLRLRAGLARAIAWITRRARLEPMLGAHRVHLLKAESAVLAGDGGKAARHYAKAVAGAADSGFIHEEGLSAERAAAFLAADGQTVAAEAYLQRARAAFARWGAAGKLAEIDRRHPHLARRPDTATAGPGQTTSGLEHSVLELAAVLRGAQAISGEIHREALFATLLRTVMEIAGAERALLTLVKGEGLVLVAEGAAGDPPVRLVAEEPLDASETRTRLACSVLSYVRRTREALVLADAGEDPRFAADPYVRSRATLAILCLPLIRQGELIGALYLENTLATDTFTAKRLELPRLLAGQIAISLENARLYDELSASSRTLEAQVEARTRELSQQSALLEATLSSITDAIVVFDAQHRLRLWNRRALELTPKAGLLREGLTYEALAAALVGAGWVGEEAVHPFDTEGNREVDLSDGRIFQVRRTRMPDGGALRVYVDVTADRLRERELRGAHEELVATQAQLIEAAKLASLGQLVAGVAHEINSPLGIVLACGSHLADVVTRTKANFTAGRLKRQEFERVLETAAETTHLIVSNSERAAELVRSFKQVAVDQASEQRRRFELKIVLEEIILSLAPLWRKAGHRMTLHCPDAIIIDGYPGALGQIITNLTTNALLHGFPDGRTGTLSVEIREEEEGILRLAFRDDGRGIAPDIRDRVFDPFFTTRRAAGSTGLGLAIIYNLATGKLGGRITLEAEDGLGTTIKIRFPRSAPAASGPA